MMDECAACGVCRMRIWPYKCTHLLSHLVDFSFKLDIFLTLRKGVREGGGGGGGSVGEREGQSEWEGERKKGRRVRGKEKMD